MMDSFAKDEIGGLSGAKISSTSSPRVSFSRSSSRLSFQDEFDDSEFSCPFAVDDDDLTDPGLRPGPFDEKDHLSEDVEPGGVLPRRQSQDAAVGTLVRMLRTAPPLRQDFSNSIKLSQVPKPDVLNKTNQEPYVQSNYESVMVQKAAKSDMDITASELLKLKTTAEALDELQSYREMRELLLKQGKQK